MRVYYGVGKMRQIGEEEPAMATATVRKREVAETPPLRTHRFTVEEYERLTEIGVLTSNDRVELIEGWIVDKMTQYPPHASAVTRINRLLARLLPDEWLLRVQAPIRLKRSEPEPDFAIVPGPDEKWDGRHPQPQDIALLIEVADSSLLDDRARKGILYAQARIAEYWIVNLVHSRIEVYTLPKTGKNPAYRHHHDFQKSDRVRLVVGGQKIADLRVSDFIP
jgi:Uma2 family endonuclease